MPLVTGIGVYLAVWWIVLFAVLPWGIKVSNQPQPGHAASAPENPRLRRKFLVTTGISAIIWLGIWLLVKSGLLDYRAAAAAMMQKDTMW